MTALCCKAQALDDTQADDFACDGRPLAPNDERGRVRVSNEISAVARAGRHHLHTSTVEVIVSGARFLAQIACEQRDRAGRGALIVCVGDVPGGNIARCASAASEVSRFALATGRSVRAEDLLELTRALKEISTEQRRRRIALSVASVGAIAVLLGVAAVAHYSLSNNSVQSRK